MTASTSFVNRSGSRPPHYRTPSPPRRAIEPISPSSAADSHAPSTHRNPSKPSVSQPVHFAPDSDGLATDGRNHNHHKSAHGRSNSTIDTLATIALATSPPFSQAASKPPSPNVAYATPLFPPESTDNSEPPSKRPRSDKRPPSPVHQHQSVGADANHFSLSDSMKGDAELLLNFARPNIPHTTAHSARTSVDESFPYSEKESARHAGAEYGGSYMGMDRKPAYDASAYNSFASSRLRSQSDGSTVTSRPVIHGVRPSTSSFTLPPITGHYEAKPIGSDSAPSANRPQHVDGPRYSTIGRSSKAEDDADSDDSNQTSCAACNLARISTNADGDDEVTWISCDGCKQWFHIACAGFKNDREVRTVDRFICRGCRPVHGPTTFVRKSSRARTAIDYAGLHQGLVKSSSDSLEHHYIEPIRQGKIQFLPENFPRMHPDLVSAEYFERGIGMTEPIVIPAHLNRRESDIDALAQEAPTQEMFDELLDHLPEDDQPFEETVDCGQDQLDMVIPEGLTVRTVADLYGPDERVEVIDVKSQQGEDKRWTMQKWADYYESTEEKVVRNVISLEISHSKLGRLIRRPKIVRDLDLQDEVWPDELKAVGDFPNVQLYCLMSVADCYTDFHIDFGGSSVFYTILQGSKTFFFIPPKEKHLKKYEEWCNSPAQDNTFLGDQTKECYRVDLREGDTMMIPSGWIHAVWTPKNSLVIGGNFLTRLNYGMQIKIAKIEKDTKVPRKFRYPFFQKVQWYAALKYLEDDPIPQSVLDAFAQDENYCFPREYPVYYEFGEKTNTSPPGSPYHNARFYSQAELEGLHELARYLLRTALIAGSYLVEGVTMEVRNAIKRSIPKGAGDPVDTIRMFGVWVAWKRGNEQAASFTRPGVIENNPKVTVADKKSTGRPSRRSERNAGSHAMYAERQAVQRPVDQPADLPNNQVSGTSVPSDTGAPAQVAPSMKQEGLKPRTVPRGSGLGPKRVACDGCRKRRIRCRHKDEQGDAIPTDQMAFGPAVQGPLTHEGASALDSLAAVASKAGFQDGAYTMGLDRLDSAGKLYAATDTPFAASARPDVSPDGINSGKKGRSKACDECRKSKRRCIHDEYGRIDPVKAQERSKPRGTNSAKRVRVNEEDGYPFATKEPKQESTSPTSRPAYLSRNEGEPDTHAAPSTYANEAFSAVHFEDMGPSQEAMAQTERPLGQNSYASPPAFQTDAEEAKEVSSAPALQPTASLVSPPTSLSDEVDLPHEHANSEVHASSEGQTVPHTPNSNSRHSSRQPRQVDRYAPDAMAKGVKPAPTRHPGTATASRRSSPILSSGVKKPSSRPTSSHAKSTTPGPKTDRQGNLSISPGQSSKSAKHERDGEVDPDTMRAIHEIHGSEFGLRRRRA